MDIMQNKDKYEKLFDYLYGELLADEQIEFARALELDGELKAEASQIERIREIYRENLSELRAPKHIVRGLYSKLGLAKPWWSVFTAKVFLRPALAGAFVFLLALGLNYQWQQSSPTVSTLHFPEAASLSQVQMRQPPSFTVLPGQQRLGMGTIMPVSLDSSDAESLHVMQNADIQSLTYKAEDSIAQFAHQQALRLRALGDCRGAAKELGRLLDKHPRYPRRTEAMAQRIDCLFQSGQRDLALSEIQYLRQVSPQLAQDLASHWMP